MYFLCVIYYTDLWIRPLWRVVCDVGGALPVVHAWRRLAALVGRARGGGVNGAGHGSVHRRRPHVVVAE